jgi:hypothetical protein
MAAIKTLDFPRLAGATHNVPNGPGYCQLQGGTAMDIEPKEKTVQNLEQTSQQPRQPEGLANSVDVKRSLNLRHQTALAWVMPEGWEPLHN